MGIHEYKYRGLLRTTMVKSFRKQRSWGTRSTTMGAAAMLFLWSAATTISCCHCFTIHHHHSTSISTTTRGQDHQPGVGGVLRPTSCRRSLSSSSSSFALAATQLLEFQEPTTGVTVQLVGSMHYNPASIRLTETTIQQLAAQNRLGAVLIESCDLRWNTTLELSPILQSLLQSEMRAAHDLALAYERPVILGDQRINVTVDRLKRGAAETVMDLVTPFSGGWQRLYRNVTEAREEAVPLGEGYLNAFAFLDPKLLLAAPVSFLKYPLSYAAKSPLASLVVFGLLFLPIPGDAMGIISADGSTTAVMTAGDIAGQLVGSLLETLLFARIFLKELLAERNEVLARNILEQCRLIAQQQQQQQSKRKPWWEPYWMQPSKRRPSNSNGSSSTTVVYAPQSVTTIPKHVGNPNTTVVAVLGMAHCNGIMKLLKEQRVS